MFRFYGFVSLINILRFMDFCFSVYGFDLRVLGFRVWALEFRI